MNPREFMRVKEPADSREGKLTILALIMMMYVIAMFISIAIHEILGHGLFAILLGGEFYAVYLSPGSGFATLWLPQGLSRAGIGLIYMAGIMMQLVIGAATLFLVMPRVKSFVLGLFTLLFCVGMLVHSSMYLFMGYYYVGGDTYRAVNLLGVRPDAFLVTGIILAGIFVLLISMAALNFMGKFMCLDRDWEKHRVLAIFWAPTFLLNGIITFFFSLFFSRTEILYPLLNSVLLLLFMGVALLLVPQFSEPERKVEYRIPVKSVFAVAVCFILLMAGWAGIFGVSRENPRGLLLHDPPVQAEIYYADYTVGNVDLTVYVNGTIRADITLRNIMESPSPLENKIYETFDRRPDWDRHVERSRYMLITMFDLPRGMGENLTFSTEYGAVRFSGTGDELGRKCTTYITLGDIGTRQYYMMPGGETTQPVMGTRPADIQLLFADPWMPRGGYLDEVRVGWEEGLDVIDILAWNHDQSSIQHNLGSTSSRMAGWENLNREDSPSAYEFSFKVAGPYL